MPVGRDYPLVDRPCHLNLDVGIGGEQRLEPVLLLVGEEICDDVQGRIVFAAPVPVEVLLNTAPALIRTVAFKAKEGRGGGPSPRPRQAVFRWGRS